MGNHTPLSIEERKNIQLMMLDEIDSFCRKNGIKYSLAFGTLLGAIRHQGFIPWDDDVDIIMPLPDMIRFKNMFKSNTIEYIDVDTVKHYEYHFSRLACKQSYSLQGRWRKSYGVNIDLYPIVGMPDTENEILSFIEDFEKINKKRKRMIVWRKRLLKVLPVSFLVGYDSIMHNERNFVLYSYPYEGAKNFLHAGSVRMVNIFDFDVFERIVDVSFEGHKLQSVERYHDYLTHLYGNYMQLPPEDQRHPYHGGIYYRNPLSNTIVK